MIKTLIKADQLYFRLISFSLFLMMNIAVFSQSKTIRIINKENGQPISDLFYKYNNTSGISNYRGEITVEFAEGKTLYLSNVQYGKNEIGSSDLKKALQTDILKIAPVAHNLLPVTVIKVHPEFFDKNQFDIPVQEKLEHDAGQLLEQMTSVSVIRKSGAYGFDPVLRGFKYDQLNLVIDGTQTASAACPNRMDPASSQIPINMISTVEVMKGPFSLRYGNAFGGTINFKSSTPQFSEKTKPAGRLGTSYESNGNIFRTEGVAGMTSNKTDLKFFGSLSQGNDYKDGDGLEIPSDFNRLNWGGKFGFKLSDKQNLGVLVTNNRAKNVDFPALPMDLREDNTWMVNASHSAYFYGKALSTWNSTVYFTRVNHLMDNLDKVISPRTVDASTGAETSNYGGRTEMRFDFKTGYLFSGLDYRMEAAEGERSRYMLMGPMAGKTIYDNVWQEAQIQRGGAFAEYHLKKSDFHAVFSGRIDYNSAKSNNPDPNFAALNPDVSSDFFNPSLSAGGTKMLNDAFSLGLWFGTAQRSPGIAERYINAFNLIDGIDGLASGLAILAAGAFGSWFYLSGHPQFAILSFALVGSLVGFFIYNVFGHRNKLFMGDTGSLIIGLVISALVVKFNEFNIDKTVPYTLSAAPAVSFAIIIVPLIDTLRVMTIRISNKKSPFSADNNHIHHRLLKLVTSHFKVTLIIIAANAFIIAFALFLNQLSLNINLQFIMVFLSGVVISFIPSIVLKLKSTEKIKPTSPIKQYS